MKKVFNLILIIFCLLLTVACASSNGYAILNKVMELDNNEELTGYHVNITTRLATSEIDIKVDKENGIIKYSESIVELNEFGEADSKYYTNLVEEFYHDGLHYYKSNDTWLTEEKTYSYGSSLKFDKSYFNKDELTKANGFVIFTADVADDKVNEFANIEGTNLSIEIMYYEVSRNLHTIKIQYVNQLGNTVNINATATYEPYSLQLPIVE